MINLKLAFLQFRMWLHDKFGSLIGVKNYYRLSMMEASKEIRLQRDKVRSLSDALNKYDQGTSLEVRQNLSTIDFDKLGDIIWIKVADQRLLRYDVFNQIRDYLRGHGKASAIMLVTGNDVELASLSDEDLHRSGLKRMQPHERQ